VLFDSDEIVEIDDAKFQVANLVGRGGLVELFEITERLDVSQQVEVSILGRHEGVIASQRKCAGVENDRQIPWSAAEADVQLAQRDGQSREILGGSPIAEINVVCNARTAEDVFGLPADDDELNLMPLQKSAIRSSLV
jgi:hypothetical protein